MIHNSLPFLIHDEGLAARGRTDKRSSRRVEGNQDPSLDSLLVKLRHPISVIRRGTYKRNCLVRNKKKADK